MASQERVSESMVQFQNAKEKPSATNIEKLENTVARKPRCRCDRVYRIARPLRGIELLILVALFAVTIHLMVAGTKSLTDVSAILLIALFATYLFILSVDLISQFTGGTLPDTPMFLFGVLGFLLFAATAEGVYILLFLENRHPLLIVIMVLCMIESILFLLDVTMWVLNWRQTCMRVDGCPFGGRDNDTTMIYQPVNNYSQRTVSISKEDVRDVSTSISDYQRLSHSDLSNLHKFRKIEVGHRREYIDRPVNAQSAVGLRVIEVQTETPKRKSVADVESLTVADVKEEPAQTTPRCPVCANNWEPHGARRPDNFGLCPTFLHLAQGLGMCNCSQPVPFSQKPILTESRTESTSATDLEMLRKDPKPSSRRNSGPDTN